MAELAPFLITKYFPESEEMLVAGGVRVSDLVESYGTPLFFYDRDVLDQKYDALRAVLPPRFSVYYSMKANPCLQVVKHFVNRGCGIEMGFSRSMRELYGVQLQLPGTWVAALLSALFSPSPIVSTEGWRNRSNSQELL